MGRRRHGHRRATARIHRARDDVLRGAARVLRSLIVNYRFVRINRAAAAQFGVAAEDLIGRRLADVLPELWPELEPIYRRVLDRGEATVDFELEAAPAAVSPGEMRHWLASFYPVRVRDELIGVGTVVGRRHRAQARGDSSAASRRPRSVDRYLQPPAPDRGARSPAALRRSVRSFGGGSRVRRGPPQVRQRHLRSRDRRRDPQGGRRSASVTDPRDGHRRSSRRRRVHGHPPGSDRRRCAGRRARRSHIAERATDRPADHDQHRHRPVHRRGGDHGR